MRFARRKKVATPAVAVSGPRDRRADPSFALIEVSYPASEQVGAVDLRTLDRHPGASISSLIPSVSSRRCSPNAPFAKLEMLTGELL
jgi:hypothetical protein